MVQRTFVALIGSITLVLAPAWQDARPRGGQAPASGTMPTVETVALSLEDATPYYLAAALEPTRRVLIRAPFDGVVNNIAIAPGMRVKQGDVLVKFNAVEAQARANLAQAHLAEQRAAALLKGAEPAVAQARIDAAEAELELARLDLAQRELRAPIDGEAADIVVGPGQFVLKGERLLTLADSQELKAIVPVDRMRLKNGEELALSIEGEEASGKVDSIVPLADEYVSLRTLAAPFACAWVRLANKDGALRPGFRVWSAHLPNGSIATVEARAVKGQGEAASVMVLRNERVVNVSVRLLGKPRRERQQVAGAFLPSDQLILSSSTPLTEGTIVRFDGQGPTTGTRNFNAEVAPIGAGAPPKKSAQPKGAPNSTNQKTSTPF